MNSTVPSIPLRPTRSRRDNRGSCQGFPAFVASFRNAWQVSLQILTIETMANPRALDKRRKSIRNIKKITRTMELIATARFKKAMDRASAATAYTDRITQVVADLANAGLQVSHPLLEEHPESKAAALLVLTANRGLCGGYNGNVIRMASKRREELQQQMPITDAGCQRKTGELPV